MHRYGSPDRGGGGAPRREPAGGAQLQYRFKDKTDGRTDQIRVPANGWHLAAAVPTSSAGLPRVSVPNGHVLLWR